MLAAYTGRADACDALLRSGAIAVDARNSDGETAAELAASEGYARRFFFRAFFFGSRCRRRVVLSSGPLALPLRAALPLGGPIKSRYRDKRRGRYRGDVGPAQSRCRAA